jgi:phosphoribosylamine--glycine ligase
VVVEEFLDGMSPVPFADAAFMKEVEEKVIRPTINGLTSEKIPYIGFVFIGLIKVNGLPYVIEYNCRMGDPETEVVIPRMKNDLVELLIATAGQKLDTVTLETDARTACTVVAVSGGYPGEYQTGYEIEGLDSAGNENTLVFHAGTKAAEGKVLTSGGRVLCVTSFGDSIESAVKRSNEELKKIRFREMYSRKDIGFEFR